MKKKRGALAVLGTSSDAGKSLVLTGLGRFFTKQGFKAAPFKAQNMSLNSISTPAGEEIARAQFLQACACKIVPCADMNPLLLKPLGQGRCQVIVQGKAAGNMHIDEYWENREFFAEKVRESYERLQEKYELILIEGAGGAAEINLRERDLSNFAMAHMADCPVLLVADIDRGGVFASLYGTWALSPPADRQRIKALLINRMRGEQSYLNSGIDELSRLTGVPLVGVIPWVNNLKLDAEDSLALSKWEGGFAEEDEQKLRIAVVKLPHIANFTDLEPLVNITGTAFCLSAETRILSAAQLLILPGSKDTIADMCWLRDEGIDKLIRQFLQKGGILVGLCGGYQMLGQEIHDPGGYEGQEDTVEGLGLLKVKTYFAPEKTVRETEAVCCLPKMKDIRVSGFEIHMGVSIATDELELAFREEKSGAVLGYRDESGQVWGTYLHGLFENDQFREAFIQDVLHRQGLPARKEEGLAYSAQREAEIERWAAVIEKSLDMEYIIDLAVHQAGEY